MTMARVTNRERILDEGLRVVHERGFAGATVREIVAAAGVPQGSFSNHFGTKEEFGLEVLDLYFERSASMLSATLLNKSLTPVERLMSYVDGSDLSAGSGSMRTGCLIGNLSVEASFHSELIRQRLVQIYAELQSAASSCLADAVTLGQLAPGTDCDAFAGFLISALQGALLRSKAERSSFPIEQYKKSAFSMFRQ
jgi:TetR/AcrR family transcriptional repressor of nem operon